MLSFQFFRIVFDLFIPEHKTHLIYKNLTTDLQNSTKRQLNPWSLKAFFFRKSVVMDISEFSLSNLASLFLIFISPCRTMVFWQKSNQSEVRASGSDAHRKPAGHWVRCVIGLVDTGTRFMRTVLSGVSSWNFPYRKHWNFRSSCLYKIMNSSDDLVLLSRGNLLLFICKKPDIVDRKLLPGLHESSMAYLVHLNISWKSHAYQVHHWLIMTKLLFSGLMNRLYFLRDKVFYEWTLEVSDYNNDYLN